jgi:hypothetical protein
MSLETIIEALGLSTLAGRDILAVQFAVLFAMVFLFAISAAMLIMAGRAARGARKARTEAEACLRNAQDVVVEARQLSVQIERATSRSNVAGVDLAKPIRVGARQTTPEADISIKGARLSDAVSVRNLDEAREASTVPRGLIRPSRHS